MHAALAPCRMLGTLAAVLADAVELHPVPRDDEAEEAADLVLEPLQLLARELDDLPAALADDVVVLRFALDRLPLADGHFHLRFALVDADGEHLLHTLDDAARFFVFAAGEETGAVLLDGRWSMQEIAPREPIPGA